MLHDTAGAGTHNDTIYLSNPQDGRKVSVDFTVEPDGSVWKLNPDLKVYSCNHAGRATSWRNFKNSEVNKVTVGIEIVQKATITKKPAYPLDQVARVAQLCAWITDTFQLVASDITTHRQIITDGSRSDPRQFPFDGDNGFWSHYWKAYGKQETYISSITTNPELV